MKCKKFHNIWRIKETVYSIWTYSFMRELSRVHISLLLSHALHEEELPLSLAAFLSSKTASVSSLNVSPDPRHLQNLLQTSTKQEYVPHKSNHVLLLLLSLNSIGWKLQVIMHLQVGVCLAVLFSIPFQSIVVKEANFPSF